MSTAFAPHVAFMLNSLYFRSVQKRGFRKQFLSHSERAEHAKIWASVWAEDHVQYSEGRIPAAEFCARMVVEVYRRLYPKGFTNGSRKNPLPLKESMSAIDTLNQFHIRSFPESAAQALLRWAGGEIELRAFERVPDPLEVLSLQSQGIRCVSIFWQEQDILSFDHEGRDFFSFLVHDLIHAQLMTQDKESYDLQMKFAHFIHQEWNTLETGISKEALGELEYMASDMNSHIVHLLKTFKSWVHRHRPDLISREDWVRCFSCQDVLNPNAVFGKLWHDLDSPNAEQAHLDLMGLWRNLCPKKS